MEKETSKVLSKSATLTSAFLLMIFGIAGTQILAAFGIPVNSFMVSGDALLFIVSSGIMRHGELINVENDIQGPGIIPIAFPLIDSPRVITSVIISKQKDGLVVTIPNSIIKQTIIFDPIFLINAYS